MLSLAMARCRAQERLEDREYSGRLDSERFYALLREAGYGEREARRAAKRRGWDRLDAGVMM